MTHTWTHALSGPDGDTDTVAPSRCPLASSCPDELCCSRQATIARISTCGSTKMVSTCAIALAVPWASERPPAELIDRPAVWPGLCIVGVADTHPLLGAGRSIEQVDFNIGKQGDRNKLNVTGKRKRVRSARLCLLEGSPRVLLQPASQRSQHGLKAVAADCHARARNL